MTIIIAEAGVNHEGSVVRANALLDAAVEAKADVFKVQYYKPGFRGKNRVLPWLDTYQMLDLRDRCFELGLEFLVTPHDYWSLNFAMETLNLGVVKIGSGDWHLLEDVCTYPNPELIVSTGMHTHDEIMGVVSTLSPEDCIMHCVSQYPTPASKAQLGYLITLFDNCHCKVGYSDHTQGMGAAAIAASMGVAIIEKHLVLERNVMERQDTFCGLSPLGFKAFVGLIRNIDDCKESLKDKDRYVSYAEKQTEAWVNKRLET